MVVLREEMGTLKILRGLTRAKATIYEGSTLRHGGMGSEQD